MSLVARCSHCGARWHVVPDQLKVSDAWLRCGACRRIFDAIELRDPQALQRDLSNAPRSGLPLLTEPAPAPPTPPPAPPPVSPPVPFSARPQSGADAGPSFLRSAGRDRVASAGQRAVLALAVLLGLLLAGLLLLWQRDRVAQWSPALGNLLEAACAQLLCDPHARRHLEAISIEQSELRRVEPQRYALLITLANATRLPVELPSVELTLTDAQDGIVLQRLLAPEDLQLAAQGSAQGSAQAGARPLALRALQTLDFDADIVLSGPPEQADRITGYRLRAVYP